MYAYYAHLFLAAENMIIRHKQFLDVCFEADYFEFDTIAIGSWMNMGYVSSWYLPVEPTSVHITDSENWECCTTPQIKCLRYGIWVPL